MVNYNQADYSIWSRNSDRSVESISAPVYSLAYQRLDIVEDWQQLDIDLKWADTSTWSLKLPMAEFVKKWQVTTPAVPTNRSSTLLSDGYGLRGILIFRNGEAWPVADDWNTGTGLPVYDNGNLVLGGVITNVKREWRGDPYDTITLTGESDTYHLKTRLTWPYYYNIFDDTTRWWLAGASRMYVDDWSYTPHNAMESIIKTLLERTMGWAAPYASITGRTLKYFYWGDLSFTGEASLANKGRGDHVPYTTRFETMYDVIQNLIKLQTTGYVNAKPGSETYWNTAHDIPAWGFDIVQVSETAYNSSGGGGLPAYIPSMASEGRLIFRFLSPIDHSTEAVFGTELGNIKSFDYEERAPDSNYCFVGGPNWSGSAQSSNDSDMLYGDAQNTDSLTKYGRIESFETSQSNEMVAPTLAKIKTIMDKTAIKSVNEKAYNLSATMTLDPHETDKFMKSFRLGDYVTTAIGGQLWKDFIREIKISVNHEQGEIVEPTVCDPWKFFWSIGATGKLSKEGFQKLKRMQRK